MGCTLTVTALLDCLTLCYWTAQFLLLHASQPIYRKVVYYIIACPSISSLLVRPNFGYETEKYFRAFQNYANNYDFNRILIISGSAELLSYKHLSNPFLCFRPTNMLKRGNNQCEVRAKQTSKSEAVPKSLFPFSLLSFNSETTNYQSHLRNIMAKTSIRY